jgi:enoyl-CoA hydratase
MLTARQVPAPEALAIGLVNRLTEGDVVTEALGLAGELSRGSLPAQLALVRAVDGAFDLPLEAGFKLEVGQEQALFEDGEAAEGIAAFVAKRPPRFA